MKLVCAICGVFVLAFQPQGASARGFEDGGRIGSPFEEVPLVQWDEPGEVAQQQTLPPAATPLPSPAPAPAPGTAETPPAEPPATGEDTLPADPPSSAEDDAAAEDDFSLGDIPVVETIELKTEAARKALDTYILVREKYKDAELENFENLQDFVDQSPQGKAFEADVKAAGFASVLEWNTTITSLSFAYDNSIDDQSADIKQQIAELQTDTEMAEDMRNRMIAALNAMIPSPNNKKVLEELKADAGYVEKLKLLESETE